MPKTKSKVSSDLLDILFDYMLGKIDAEDVDAKVEELAYYQRDIRSGVDAYYAGIA